MIVCVCVLYPIFTYWQGRYSHLGQLFFMPKSPLSRFAKLGRVSRTVVYYIVNDAHPPNYTHCSTFTYLHHFKFLDRNETKRGRRNYEGQDKNKVITIWLSVWTYWRVATKFGIWSNQTYIRSWFSSFLHMLFFTSTKCSDYRETYIWVMYLTE
jgi:hypothetical protein